jgi:hypothetical protein
MGGIETGYFHTSTYFSLDDLRDETCENTSQSAFPAAGRPGHHQAFSEAYVEGNILQHLVIRIGNAQVMNMDHVRVSEEKL